MEVLDLYAGTGSVGFDLLDHGAEHVDFVEIDGRRSGEIKAEAGRRGYQTRATVHRSDVANVFAKLNGKRYDLVFADPPYELDPWEDMIAGLRTHDLIKQNSWIIAEHAARKPLPQTLSGAFATKRRRYGDSAITIYSLNEPQDNPG